MRARSTSATGNALPAPLANGKIYEFNVIAPDAAFSKVQRLVDANLRL